MKKTTAALPVVLGLLCGQAAARPAAVPPPPSPASTAAELDARGASVTVAIAPGSTVLGSSLAGVDSFSGIPFAQPPVGPLRLKPPRKLGAGGLNGTFNAQGIAPSCPQMFFSDGTGGFLTEVLGDVLDTPLFQTVSGAQEDCLTVSVQRPSGTAADAKLPVLFWIFGGGFEVRGSGLHRVSERPRRRKIGG